MSTRAVIALLGIMLVAGCTTAGNPEPGERAQQIFCERGTLKVCTDMASSRIKKPTHQACSCN